ncbi:MAG: hypothetical protein ABFE16_11490 [Armatimonadia bacterium]
MGAPDFYFAINATFNHILRHFGEGALYAYWEEMGREHYAAVTEAVRERGLPALQEHWEQLFAEEPGSEIACVLEGDCLTLEVRTCPAFRHLLAHGREPMPLYCDHCLYVSQGMLEPVGVGVEIEGGQGSCVQRFRKKE